MSKSKQPVPDQLRISSFFSQGSSSSAAANTSTGRRARSPIDLTEENEAEHPAKKRKVSLVKDGAAQTSPKRATAPLSTQTSGAVDKYRFEPGSPVKEKPLVRGGDASRSQRTERLRKILDDRNLFRRSDDAEDPVGDSDHDADEEKDAEHDIEPSASTLENTLEFFRNVTAKPRGTQRGKAPHAKKAQEIGPSGLPFTPLELQIRDLRKQHTGTLLMFEVGYKFRFFGDDATIAAKELGIVAFQNRNFLTASIPVHRRDVHLKKLLSQGHKVGLVEQTETAALKKAGDTRNELFSRKLTRLYTAATFVDQLGSVDETGSSVPPLMCLVEELRGGMGPDERVSISMIAVSAGTGDVVWDQFEDNHMRTELETRMVHINPSELLLPETKLSKSTEKMLSYFTTKFYTDHAASNEQPSDSGEVIATISNFPKQVIIALAQCIKYLSAFEVADTLLETKFFSKFTERTHMLLNGNTITNLEIYRNETDFKTKGSLLWILDNTTTKFGARMLRSWIGRPLTDTAMLKERTDAVEEILATTSPKLTTIRQQLRGLPDLARGLCRIQYGKCTPQELAVLLPAFNKIATAFDRANSPAEVGFQSSILNDVIYSLPKLKGPIQDLLRVFSLKAASEGKKESLWTDPDKYPELDGIMASIEVIESELVDELKKVRKIIKKPALQYSTWNGEEYLIEIKKNENREVPVTWSLISSTKIFRRYRPPEVRAKVEQKAQLVEGLEIEANRAFQSFLAEISRHHYGIMRDCVNKLSVIDCLSSLALVAMKEGYTRPSFCNEDVLDISEGRHPMVEALRDEPFVPNSVSMGGQQPRSKIITGPNMGGKSSAVRMIALCVIMAQIGSYVPAKSMKLSVHDGILVRMGASDELARGRSTFMVEMQETSDILHLSTRKTLVILDELGRGTSTFDGMAVASAVLEHLVQHTRCRTLFITHYPQVATDLEKKFPADIQNLHMGFVEDTRLDGTREVAFLYKLEEGIAVESFGIECARLAGVPDQVLQIAIQHSEKLREMIERRIKMNKARRGLKLLQQAASFDLEPSRQVLQNLRMTFG
ncbi:Mismatch repair protein msh3 [Steccherinum ochraceum]|uniref:DNA mismatch repair protein MSH3 n=1 Tax=Steccherinum ochraceum TaxID=92696 RepID=A0A4R0RCA1_9APHY|nr:Mismatch repair protein msh3 [Steccherinum ochraceum]